MAESLADRMQLCKDRYNDIPQCLIDEVRALGLLVVKLEEKLDDIDTCELCEGEVEGCSICLECWNKLAPGAAELKATLLQAERKRDHNMTMWKLALKNRESLTAPHDGSTRYYKSQIVPGNQGTVVYWWERDGKSGDCSFYDIPRGSVISEMD